MALHLTAAHTSIVRAPCDGGGWCQLARTPLSGRLVTYESNESGRPEIYVRPFPNVDADRQQVSTNGRAQPLWARNG